MELAIFLKQGDKRLIAQVRIDDELTRFLTSRNLQDAIRAVGPFADNPDKEIEYLTQTLNAFGYKDIRVSVENDISQ